MQRYQLYHRAVAMSKKYPDQKYDDILKSLMDTKTASDDVTKSQTTVKNTNQSAKQPQKSLSLSQSQKAIQPQQSQSQSQLAIQPQQGPKKLITVIIKFQLIN